jgi:hypothetical protein
MGFRFRRSVKLMPGVRLNASTRGLSVSVGGRGGTVNIGRRGVRTTVSLPGTGLSYSTQSPWKPGAGPGATRVAPAAPQTAGELVLGFVALCVLAAVAALFAAWTLWLSVPVLAFFGWALWYQQAGPGAEAVAPAADAAAQVRAAPSVPRYPLRDGLSTAAQHLIDTRPRLWEHRLFAQVLADEVAHAAPAYQGAFLTPIPATGEAVPGDAFFSWMQVRLADARHLIEEIGETMNQALPPALGPAGQPGDPEALVAVGRRLATCYHDALAWRARVRGAGVSDSLAEAQKALSTLADVCIAELHAYGPRARSALTSALAQLDGGGAPAPADLQLNVALPPGALEWMQRALQRASAGRPGIGQV